MNLFQELKEKKILDKDGKVDALGPYGKQKLTGQEVASYFKKNKVSDAKVKRAVEVALDLGGAMDVARKEIKKFFGDKILKTKEVQTALRYANESVVTEMTHRLVFDKAANLDKAEKIAQKLGLKTDSETQSKYYYLSVNDGGNTSNFVKFLKQTDGLTEEVVNEVHKSSLAINPKTVKQSKPLFQKIAKKLGVELEFGIDGHFPSVLQVKAKSAQASKGFYDAVGKDKKLMKLIDHVEHDAEAILENYRVLAKHGMGTETKNSIRVGTEIDYYRADGAKYMGKVIKMTAKTYIVKDDKNGKNYQFTYHDRVKAKKYLKQGDNPAQQAAIAIAKKEKEKKNVMDSYRQMWEDAVTLDEAVADITVDPKNRINSGQQQGYHGMEIAKQARRMGLKSAVMHKHVRIKGSKKDVNDFLRLVIGKSRYGDPTEKDMSTPQVDKMLTKGLK